MVAVALRSQQRRIPSEMPNSKDAPRLEQLWTINASSGLNCIACNQKIGKDEALIRTFRPVLRHARLETSRFSRTISGIIWDYHIFDRHQQCCLSRQNGLSRSFIAISHVWDPAVSVAHHQGRSVGRELQASVSTYIFEMLERISNGLSEYIKDDTEIWYDYISVPQWEQEVKERILSVIPDIFRDLSKFTLIYLHDVEAENLERLRGGSMLDDERSNQGAELRNTQLSARAIAVTQICNAKWFSRVWTISEFIHSPKIKVMMKEGLVDPKAHHALILRLARVWEEESRQYGDLKGMENSAISNQDLVPWNLGFLVRARNRGKVDFGFAFAFLSRRGCYSDKDFCYAMLGLLKAHIKAGDLDPDPKKAWAQIAVSCMYAGDYSPLLMNPRSPNIPPLVLKRSGYVDVAAFALGNGKGTPRYHKGSTFSPTGSKIRLESIGKITFASKMTHTHQDPIIVFLQNALTVLDYTGPEPKAFIKTVTERMYNLHADDVMELLNSRSKCQRIRTILEDWYNNTTRFARKHRDAAQELADLLGLTSIWSKTNKDTTPLDYMNDEGSALHAYSPGSLIAARCPGCHETFVYQAGLHRSPSEVRGAVAYRIAGVHWGKARSDGAGILVKNGVIVGRLVWASRACACKVVKAVDVRLENLPSRFPRETTVSQGKD